MKTMEDRIYKYNQSTFKVIFGNILNSRTNVIVSSDDCYLSEGGGISGAIANAGGAEVFEECRKMVPARLGDVVVTTAGKLPHKYIFHCITISFHEADSALSFQTAEDYHRFVIGRAVDKCFRLMNALDLESIAFPCIGAGAAGIPPESFAAIMADRVAYHMCRTSKSYQIELYLYDHLLRWEKIDYLPVFEKIAIASALAERTLQEDSAGLTDERITGSIEESSEISDTGMAHQVFISYSRKDAKAAKQICSFLDEHGFTYWIDTDGMLSRDSFKAELVDAIKTSAAVLFLSSKASNASQYVAKEIALAVKYEKMVIPLMLDDASYSKSIEFDLAEIDRLDFRGEYEKKLLDNLAFAIHTYENR